MCSTMQSNRFHDWLRTSQPGTVSSASFHRREQDLAPLRKTTPLFTENFGGWPVIENTPPSYTKSERVSYNQSAEPKREVEENLRLPPGFRFHPTDEELVTYYLTHKVLNSSVAFQAIGQVDFNKCEPWDLPAKAKMGESVFYFFSLRDKKYPTGMRTNRATEAGYWKATGKDREVMTKSTGKLLGMKKTLVFYTGRAPKGEKTNWIMHEYRLEGELRPDQQEWAVCRVFKKSVSNKKPLPDSRDNNSYNEYTDQPYSTSPPALQNFPFSNSGSSSSSPNYPYASHNTLSELQGDFQGVLRRTNNCNNWSNVSVSNGVPSNGLSMRVRKDTGLNETLEHMVPGNWDLSGDLYSHDAEPIWDVDAGTT